MSYPGRKWKSDDYRARYWDIPYDSNPRSASKSISTISSASATFSGIRWTECVITPIPGYFPPYHSFDPSRPKPYGNFFSVEYIPFRSKISYPDNSKTERRFHILCIRLGVGIHSEKRNRRYCVDTIISGSDVLQWLSYWSAVLTKRCFWVKLVQPLFREIAYIRLLPKPKKSKTL